jgi:lactoylglutathione lyase
MQRFPAGPGIEIAFMGNGVNGETLVELLADSNATEVHFSDSLSIGFAVVSADSMLETVKSKNIPICGGLMETPKFKFFMIKDPNGLNIQFFQQK